MSKTCLHQLEEYINLLLLLKLQVHQNVLNLFHIVEQLPLVQVEVYGKEAKLDIIVYMKDVATRKITLKDTDKIVKWGNSPAVMNNFIVRNKLTKKQHINWLNNKVKKGKVVQFIAVDI